MKDKLFIHYYTEFAYFFAKKKEFAYLTNIYRQYHGTNIVKLLLHK